MWRITIFRMQDGLKLVDKIAEMSTRKKCTDWANKRKVTVRNNPLVEIKEIPGAHLCSSSDVA